MRIAYIVPGSGNTFYCQNCFRDLLLVKALRRRGHDVIMVPMYLPLFDDDGTTATAVPVFYGAVSLYLRHRFTTLRRLPRALTRLLDAPPLLRLAAREAGSTRARGHEAMTRSMLLGEEGQQADELEQLAAWLATQGPVDVVHLSNALLLGLARRLRQRLGAAVVCSLQDEDTWIDAMDEAAARDLWHTMSLRAADVAAFLAVSRHYAARMQPRLAVPDVRLHVVPMGVDPAGHEIAPLNASPPAIGYLSRIAESEGFGLLAEAFMLLKQEPELRHLKLVATGGHTRDNLPLIARVRRQLAARGWEADLTILPAFDRASRLQFLQSLTVLSVPALKGEAFGSYLLEAMASGVPVVQPRLGAFPEVLDATGGGILYAPNNAAALAAALKSVIGDLHAARALGRRGREAVLARFSIERAAAATAAVYESVVARQQREPAS